MANQLIKLQVIDKKMKMITYQLMHHEKLNHLQQIFLK